MTHLVLQMMHVRPIVKCKRESLDTVASSVNLWRANTNYNPGTDVKDNVKNDRCQELGDNSVMKAGTYVVDVDLFRQTGVSKEVCAPKNLASEKLVESLLSFETQNKA